MTDQPDAPDAPGSADTATGEPGTGRDEARPAGRPVRRSRAGLVATLVAVGCLALAAVAVVSTRANDDDGDTAADDGWAGTVLGTARPRPEFTLTDTAGQPYDFAAETEGRLTLLFFGYTSCPDICPIHMATLSAALREPDMPEPLVVFVTTDPRRDTAEALRSWLDGFSSDFVGLRGTPEEIRTAENAAQVAPAMVPAEAEGSDDYEVGHASQLIAYTADDRSHIVYPFGVRREDWIADLPRLADGWSGT